jgi:hypothetical protein
MEMLKNNCVLDLTAWKYLGDFAADVVFKLITYNADIKREYVLNFSRFYFVVLFVLIKLTFLFGIPGRAKCCQLR